MKRAIDLVNPSSSSAAASAAGAIQNINTSQSSANLRQIQQPYSLQNSSTNRLFQHHQ